MDSYNNFDSNFYFWRTYDKQEIDLIEERDGHLIAYEFKWSSRKMAKCPKAFAEAYPDADFYLINPDNILDFIL